EVEGAPAAVQSFLADLPVKRPPLAVIEKIETTFLPPVGYPSFVIEASAQAEGGFVLVSPDICTCPDCQRELFAPADRRYGYPFTNCTNCGPRFTIIRDIPYDRPLTTMVVFTMCPDCAAEYHDPADRRFHAQPNACPVCGPHVWLETSSARSNDLSRFQPSNCSARSNDFSRFQPSSCDARSNDFSRFQPSSCDARSNDFSRFQSNNCLPRTTEVVTTNTEAIAQARRLLVEGRIVAVKGLGGFHLACDATNDAAVRLLRQRKRRVDKPFALMSPDVATIEKYCFVSDGERQLLESPQRPIVLLRRRPESPISPAVAPGNNFLGVMLPYTPLHYLLLTDEGRGTSYEERVMSDEERGTRDEGCSSSVLRPSSALVMTSGNMAEEPIATDNAEARQRLAPLADTFLMHNRDIHVRCDDSVTRLFEGREMLLRRSRGYAPFPLRLGFELQEILAVGGELKNTFCLTKGTYAFLSQHIGDLENWETLASFEANIEHFQRLFRVNPTIIAHDLHPDYLSTKWVNEGIRQSGNQEISKSQISKSPISNLQSPIPVQHHHAHMASVMAEHGLNERVIGVSWDGTGYGTDGQIWGGEFLVGDYTGFRRAAHLKYVRLPGGEAAIRRPLRMALSHLVNAYGEAAWSLDLPALARLEPAERAVVRHQIETGFNSPWTSSAGRLFDAVSALLDVRDVVNYEGQAAIELEMLVAEDVDEEYEVIRKSGNQEIRESDNARFPDSLITDALILDPAPLLRAVVDDLLAGTPRPVMAARFHNTLARLIVDTCGIIRQQEGLNKVCLSGGVFQNVTLLSRTLRGLREAGFAPYIHHLVPPNDGGIALGQALVAHFSAQAM
ncbi:MAG: carbamoyltransferase HypF, partial [Chloroflexi bacterium]|nr:carbamoyltransferase HypF [Chloroflexota bacterium]